MPGSFKIVFLAIICIIHLTKVSHTVKGENCKKSISESPFDTKWRFTMSGLENDDIFPFPFGYTDNMCLMLYATLWHVTQVTSPKSWITQEKKNKLHDSSVTKRLALLTNRCTHFLALIHEVFHIGYQTCVSISGGSSRICKRSMYLPTSTELIRSLIKWKNYRRTSLERTL